jgi:hypothetical protein
MGHVVISYQLSAVSYQPEGALSRQLSAISQKELSAVSCQLSAREEPSAVSHQLSAREELTATLAGASGYCGDPRMGDQPVTLLASRQP